MSNIKKYIIDKSVSIRDALIRLDALSDDALTLFVTDGKRLIGTLTDGDIRRYLIKNNSLEVSVEKVMHRNFAYISPGEKNIKKLKDKTKTKKQNCKQ